MEEIRAEDFADVVGGIWVDNYNMFIYIEDNIVYDLYTISYIRELIKRAIELTRWSANDILSMIMYDISCGATESKDIRQLVFFIMDDYFSK